MRKAKTLLQTTDKCDGTTVDSFHDESWQTWTKYNWNGYSISSTSAHLVCEHGLTLCKRMDTNEFYWGNEVPYGKTSYRDAEWQNAKCRQCLKRKEALEQVKGSKE